MRVERASVHTLVNLPDWVSKPMMPSPVDLVSPLWKTNSDCSKRDLEGHPLAELGGCQGLWHHAPRLGERVGGLEVRSGKRQAQRFFFLRWCFFSPAGFFIRARRAGDADRILFRSLFRR